jgi:hypothetical protein
MSDPQFPRPDGRAHDRAHDRIAAFLVMDIQRSPDWARDLLAKIADVKTGARSSWERIGNAYRLSLSTEGALIEDLVDPASAPPRIPLEELETAVRAWLEAIG